MSRANNKESTHRFSKLVSNVDKFFLKVDECWLSFFMIAGTALIGVFAGFAPSFSWDVNCTDSTFDWGCYGWGYTITNPWFWIVIGVILCVYGQFGIIEAQRKLNLSIREIEKLNAKNDALNINLENSEEYIATLKADVRKINMNHVVTWLKLASNTHKLNHSERVSIYYNLDSDFYLLARYSMNPKLNDSHRLKFPINQGVISKAWENGRCIDLESCPIYVEDEAGYIKYMNDRYGCDENKTRSLTMKSCQYIGVAIHKAGKHVGVIVFESEIKKTFVSQKVNRIVSYCDEYQGYLCEFIQEAIDYDISATIRKEAEVQQPDKEALGILNVGGGNG